MGLEVGYYVNVSHEKTMLIIEREVLHIQQAGRFVHGWEL